MTFPGWSLAIVLPGGSKAYIAGSIASLVRAAARCEKALQPASGHASSARGKPTRSTKGAQVALGRDR